MKNLTLYATLSLVLGIVSNRYNLIRIEVILSILPLISAIVYCLINNKKYLLYAALVGSFFILGTVSTSYYSADRLTGIYGDEVEFTGLVTGINIPGEGSPYYPFSAQCTILGGGSDLDSNMIVYLENAGDIEPGMTIRGRGTVLEPSKAGNFLEFDYKNYLMNRGIGGILISSEFTADKTITWSYSIKNGFREYIIKVVDDRLKGVEGGLLKGILLGDTDFIDEDLLENIRGLGAAHVLAVSGLHIGIIIASIGFLLGLIRMNRRHGLVVSLCMGWAYAWLIGFPLSVVRALTMMTFLILGFILHRKYDMMNSIMNAVCLMLIARPLWLFDMGFQLSFAAVIGICIFNKATGFFEMSKPLKYLLFIFFVQIFVFPVSLYYFNHIALLGILANLLIVPLVSATLFLTVMVLPLSLVSGFPASLLFLLVEAALRIVIFVSGILIDMRYAVLDFRSPGPDEIVIYYLILAIIIYFISNPEERYRLKSLYKAAALMMAIHVSLFHLFPLLAGNGLKVSVVNVGQGSASLIQHGYESYMIDAGGTVRGDYEVADRLLPDYLVKRGIGVLDAVFVTHYHADHYSGIDKISEKVKIRNIISNHMEDMIISEFNRDTGFLQINRGDRIDLDDDLAIDVIWPPLGFESDNENNNSLVLLVDFKGTKILFTGDIEREVEEAISASLGKTDILMVPHHGSETSSSENFLLKTLPDCGIMSYGENNYGIPDGGVIDRYHHINASLYETFIDGEVVIEVDSRGGYTIKCLNDSVESNLVVYMVASVLLVAAAYLTGNSRSERKCHNEQQGSNNIDRQ